MLDLNRITEGFRRLSGLSEDEVNECRELCKGAAEHILRLVPCVSGSNGGKAEFAAAVSDIDGRVDDEFVFEGV